MSSVSSKDSANDPARPRTEGIDPFTLKTVAQFYEHGGIFDDPEEEFFPHDTALNEKVIVWRGDITKLSVDAIVNAANRSLLGGGGVDGAIHSAAGRGLYQECKTLDGAETGESKITGGHRLPALHVIHTVGPIYSSSKKATCESQLRSCYQTTLELAVANNCKTLAFSGISTGIYGYPLDDATHVALDVVRTFLATDRGASVNKVIFTVFRQIDVDSYFNIVPSFFPPPPKANIDKDVENSTSTEVADKDGGGAEEPTPEASEAKSEEPANVEEGAGSESATIAKENEEELETGGIKETGLKSEEQEKRKPESKDDA
ncbi:A1pp-domain-containing protein [Meredithblackwellia eburnea MCA 4105]